MGDTGTEIQITFCLSSNVFFSHFTHFHWSGQNKSFIAYSKAKY